MMSLRSNTACLARHGARSYSSFGHSRVPKCRNEPFQHYEPGSVSRAKLRAALDKLRAQAPPEIPCIVGGEKVYTGIVHQQVMPSDHQHVICKFHEADDALAAKAVKCAIEAREKWSRLPHEDRASVWLKAADLLSTVYRADVCAAVMLGTGKTAWQAEIDAAVETIDFWRFGPTFVQQIYDMQPTENAEFCWNRTEYRPLEGFVAAITPFNFAAIGINLPSTPALVGNGVLWKPSSTALLGNYMLLEILQEAGLPPGVINFIPGHAVSSTFSHRDFAGLHFTGSTATFNKMWVQLAANLPNYRSYPRIVGETGGKNFHMVHASADVDLVVNQTIRSAFEYQGQKCSACSRAYFPKSLWPKIKQGLIDGVAQIKMGQPDDFSTFMTAVIDRKSFDNAKGYIEHARKSSSCTILTGGRCDDSRGFFVEPTIIVTTDPNYRSMREEIFAPVLTVFVYDDASFEDTLKLVDDNPYALTGAVFSRDRMAIDTMSNSLRNAAGNFYINDKSTGAIVAQQPFGGARGSGTNDKSGSALNYLRWMSARSIKESFSPLSSFSYASMLPDKPAHSSA